MLITDLNKMTLKELEEIFNYLHICYELNDGRIVKTNKKEQSNEPDNGIDL